MKHINFENSKYCVHFIAERYPQLMKTTIYIGMSLDGLLAKEDGSLDWLTNYDIPEIHFRHIGLKVFSNGLVQNRYMKE